MMVRARRNGVGKLAQHREEMTVALRDGLSLAEARLKLARLRLQETVARCGRTATDVAVVRTTATRSAEPNKPSLQPRYWWIEE